MPQKPEDLSRIIREMAREAARDKGRLIAARAEDRIALIPPDYARRPQILVDLGQLRGMVEDIIEIAVTVNRETIGLRDMERALREVKCHYLWFC